MTRAEKIFNKGIKFCTKCIYDEKIPGITFNESGVCNYCQMICDIETQFKTGEKEGIEKFEKIIEKIKFEGKGKKYDCIIGVSGGTDSSYLLKIAIDYGLRPLAVHFDNTWNTAIATENIRKVLSKLNIDLYTYVVDNKEMDDIYKSFLLAGVPDIDAPTDLALAETLYRAAFKYKVKYILEGHSYKTEGISPLGYMYMDGKYIKSVHKKYGNIKMKTYPLMTLKRFLFWVIYQRIVKVRPLWYLNYDKNTAREILINSFGWEYYGGHHLENRLSAFYHSYYCPVKFNIDQRNNSLSAEVRSKLKTRNEALNDYLKAPDFPKDLLEYCLKRFKLSNNEFQEILSASKRSYHDFPTYKKYFEYLRPLFWYLTKKNLVPVSFYLKYCFPTSKK